jgi:hypothetical protein
MTFKFDYSHTTFPPSPSMKIVLQTFDEGLSSSSLTAIVDTGADASFVPLPILESINAPLGEPLRARSLWGEWEQFSTYVVDIQIGDLIFPSLEVLGYSGEELILGRDVLNKLWLGLDGPQHQLEVAEKSPRRKR